MSQVQQSRNFGLDPQLASYFLAGGVAGAASRTIVSPLERLKIIQQVQTASSTNTQYKGVWRSLVRMWKEEGVKGYMRGNGANCLRIIPYSAVQFTTYEQLKRFFTRNGNEPLNTPTRLLAGALAGVTSVSVTYPLDLVRARLSVASASFARVDSSAVLLQQPGPSQVPGMFGMMLRVMKEEGGTRALYRGLVPTALGVAPYVGINFASYELLRGYITPPDKTTVPRKLLCGALAGSISQTVTYPLDVLRRKVQMATCKGFRQYNGAIDAIQQTIKYEGFAGLYRGLWPNLLKVAPSIATSFFTYETVKEFLASHYR